MSLMPRFPSKSLMSFGNYCKAMKDTRLRSNSPSIGTVSSLASHLGIPESALREVANSVDDHWRPGKKIKKKGGGFRETNSATPELKSIHKRINAAILRRVYYPDYLYGSIPKSLEFGARDHVANAKLHSGRRFLITTDIKGYFPSITDTVVRSIWQGFFPFGPEVAEVLTKLTVHNGSLPQGWACSSYLAQLVFWRQEPDLVSALRKQGIYYSRLTDDISLSTNKSFSASEVTDLMRKLIGMLRSRRTTIHRGKTRVAAPSRRQVVNNVNISLGRLTLSQEYRKTLRARVHRLSADPQRYGGGLAREIQSATSQVLYLKRFHHKEAKRLAAQIKQLELSLTQ